MRKPTPPTRRTPSASPTRRSAICVVGILHPNEDIGEVEPYEVRQRVRGQVWRGNDAIAPAYAALAEAAGEAEALLSRARPADERQRYRV